MITISTRKSKLAMWQTESVAAMLKKAGLESEILSMETLGDKVLNTSIAKIGSKGVFTEELEQQLASGVADIAVHSAKDLQSVLPESFELIAFTERESVYDVLLSRGEVDLNDATKPLVIGTSSVRRRAFLRHYFPHVKLVDMRGNLQTRIGKMDAGDCDALILAFAGVRRMGYESMIVHQFDPAEFIPPVGQGCIAVESAVGLDAEKRAAVRAAVNDEESEVCLVAERAFLKKLEGGCSIPAFGYATLNDGRLLLRVGLSSLDGAEMIHREETILLSGAKLVEAAALGTRLGGDVLVSGGKRMLAEIRAEQG